MDTFFSSLQRLMCENEISFLNSQDSHLFWNLDIERGHKHWVSLSDSAILNITWIALKGIPNSLYSSYL